MIAASDANLAATTEKTIIIPGHGQPVSNRSELKDFRDVLVAIRDNVGGVSSIVSGFRGATDIVYPVIWGFGTVRGGAIVGHGAAALRGRAWRSNTRPLSRPNLFEVRASVFGSTAMQFESLKGENGHDQE
jgi:hypothetical protein